MGPDIIWRYADEAVFEVMAMSELSDDDSQAWGLCDANPGFKSGHPCENKVICIFPGSQAFWQSPVVVAAAEDAACSARVR
jgi:hypothetical protein